MTNPNRKEWYESMISWPEMGVSHQELNKIVAEAERRGRVAAWEEAKSMLQAHMMISGGRRDIDALRDIDEKIEDKLASLANEK